MTTQAHLTRRQMQIAICIALGLSNDETGARLGISSRTAKAHADRLRWKLEVDRRRKIPAALEAMGVDLFALESSYFDSSTRAA